MINSPACIKILIFSYVDKRYYIQNAITFKTYGGVSIIKSTIHYHTQSVIILK